MKSQLDYNAKIRLKKYPTRNDTILLNLPQSQVKLFHNFISNALFIAAIDTDTPIQPVLVLT